MTKKTNLEELWFLVRWVTGLAIELVITLGGSLAMFWFFFAYLAHPPQDIPIIPNGWLTSPFMAFSVSLGVLGAFMAGRQWWRNQYFTHILPEVWSDTIQSLIQKANNEHDDKNN